MAVRLQSNYLYNSNDFLDSRQSEALTIADLRDWFNKENEEDIIRIPEGFEVRVGGDWYTYEPNKEMDPETGYFKPRLTEESLKDLLPDVIRVGDTVGVVTMY